MAQIDSDGYDDEAAELAKFPPDLYEHVPVTGEGHAHAEIARRMMNDPEPGPMFGQFRWFGPGRGMLFIDRARSAKAKVVFRRLNELRAAAEAAKTTRPARVARRGPPWVLWIGTAIVLVAAAMLVYLKLKGRF